MQSFNPSLRFLNAAVCIQGYLANEHHLDGDLADRFDAPLVALRCGPAV